MTDSGAGKSEESTPLLSRHHHENKQPVPILRARIISALVPVFAISASSARDSLLAQYLFERLADDEGYDNATHITGVCFKNKSDPKIKMADEIQTHATELLTYYGFVQTIPAFFNCLLIGSYSDYLGRRPLLLIPLFTNMVKMIMVCMIIKFNLNLNFMYLAYGIDGMAGSWFSILLALYALTADISSSVQSRTFWIYFLACCAGTMSAAANVANGFLILHLGFFYASLLLSAMTAVAFIVPLFLLPETLPQRSQEKQLNPFVHLRRIFGFYFFDGSKRKRMTCCICLALFIVGVASLMNISSTDALYQMHEPFCWDSTHIGNYQAIRSAGAYILGAFWLRGFQRCVHPEKIAMIGTLFQGAMYTYEAFIKKTWQFYLVPVVGIPGTGIVSVIRSLLSLLAGPDRQGAVFSSVAVVETVCSLVAVTSWNKIYGATVSFMPGAVYLVMAGCSFSTFILFVIYLCVREQPQLNEQEIHVDDPGIQNTKA